MHDSTKRIVRQYLRTAGELSKLTGIKKNTIQQRAFRDLYDFVLVGEGKGVMLFDVRDFVQEITHHKEHNNADGVSLQ